MVLTALLIASVIVTAIDSKIIAATGARFPVRRWWRQ
jgi:hypothetical protein